MNEEGTFENYYSTYNLIKVFKIEKIEKSTQIDGHIDICRI